MYIRTTSPPVDSRYSWMSFELWDLALSVTNDTLPYFWRSSSRKTLSTENLVEPAAIMCGMSLPKAPKTFRDLLGKVVFGVSHPPRGSQLRPA